MYACMCMGYCAHMWMHVQTRRPMLVFIIALTPYFLTHWILLIQPGWLTSELQGSTFSVSLAQSLCLAFHAGAGIQGFFSKRLTDGDISPSLSKAGAFSSHFQTSLLPFSISELLGVGRPPKESPKEFLGTFSDLYDCEICPIAWDHCASL